MNAKGGDDLASMVTGLMLAQAALVEALVRHDAIAYHQVRQTLGEAAAALGAEAGAEEAELLPLNRLLETLDRTHAPLDPDAGRPRLDWRRVLADCRAG